MKKFLKLFGIIFMMMLVIPRTYALDLAMAGDSITQEGEYDSIRLAAGNNVINKATVDGISLVAGNNITLEGSTPYGFYAGNIINFNEKITKDAFVAGNSIVIDSDAIIGRDLFIAGEDVTIKTTIGRNLHAGAGSIDLRGAIIMGDAYIDADKIIMDNETKITGKLSYLEDANVSGLNKDNIGSVKTHKSNSVAVEYNPMDNIYSFLFSVIAAFVVMAVLFYIIPNTKEKLDDVKLDASIIAKLIGIGAVILLLIPFAVVITLFTGFLTPLSLIVLALYVIAIYMSTLLSAYVIGNVIMKNGFKKENVYLALIIGIMIVRLVKYIPIIGGFMLVLCLTYGMGLIYRYVVSLRK